jgi:cytochrome bd-type quinol oxidase subunit 1
MLWTTTGWVLLPGVLLGVVLVLLFPDGRLPARALWIVVWMAIFGTALSALALRRRPGL